MPARPLVIAIDGPSGVGKSTVARRLAVRLDLPFLETGAMYRALGWRCLETGVNPGDREAVEALLTGLDLRLERGEGERVRVLLDGAELGQKIRSPEVSQATSRVSVHSQVRRRMVAMQREFAARSGAVMEGRDIGSRVFPDTPFKFFLTAREEIRVERRFLQLRGSGRSAVTREEVASEVESRDRRDAGRSESPLTLDASYELVDTSDRSPEEVVEHLARRVAALSSAFDG